MTPRTLQLARRGGVPGSSTHKSSSGDVEFIAGGKHTLFDTASQSIDVWEPIAYGQPAGFVAPVPNGEFTDEDPLAPNPLSGAQQAEEVVATGDPGSVLEVKYLDEVLDAMTGQWSVRPTPIDHTTAKKRGKYDAYAFTVVRRFNPSGPIGRGGRAVSYNVSKALHIQSEELRKVGAEVIGKVQGVSWTAKPCRVS